MCHPSELWQVMASLMIMMKHDETIGKLMFRMCEDTWGSQNSSTNPTAEDMWGSWRTRPRPGRLGARGRRSHPGDVWTHTGRRKRMKKDEKRRGFLDHLGWKHLKMRGTSWKNHRIGGIYSIIFPLKMATRGWIHIFDIPKNTVC